MKKELGCSRQWGSWLDSRAALLLLTQGKSRPGNPHLAMEGRSTHTPPPVNRGPDLITSGHRKRRKASPWCWRSVPPTARWVLVQPCSSSEPDYEHGCHAGGRPWCTLRARSPAIPPVAWSAGGSGSRSKPLEHITFAGGGEGGDRGPSEPSCKVGLKHIHSRWCCHPHSGILIPNYLCCQPNN